MMKLRWRYVPRRRCACVIPTQLILFFLLTFCTLPLYPQIVVDTVAGGKIRSGVPAQDVPFSRVRIQAVANER